MHMTFKEDLFYSTTSNKFKIKQHIVYYSYENFLLMFISMSSLYVYCIHLEKFRTSPLNSGGSIKIAQNSVGSIIAFS